MKEHPILFNGEMVRALLDGHKTQTRRVIKPQPEYAQGDGKLKRLEDMSKAMQVAGSLTLREWCPYGHPGDRLWVRETWQTHCDCDHISPRDLTPDSYIQYPATYDGWVSKRRPSIFMPRWASRITLEIADVRVERVQEISEEDAKAEGVKTVYGFSSDGSDGPTTYIDAYAQLWNDINAKRGYSWESNSWVWCVSFQRVTQ